MARAASALALAAAIAACADGDGSAAEVAGSDGWFGRRGAGAPPIIAPRTGAYREIDVARGGRVRGVVRFDGERPADAVVRPTSHQGVCGETLVPATVQAMGDRLAGAVVWLADVGAGKRVPLARRFDVVNDGCQLTPRVQAALVRGTLNVRNADAAPHRNRLLRQRTGRTIALVSEYDEGQVVPVDRAFTEPGMIEVRCDDHPWTRAWIAVFDHPYFALSGRDGSFTLDSVPPGSYTLVVWHERFGKVEQRVTVAGGRDSAAEVRLRGE